MKKINLTYFAILASVFLLMTIHANAQVGIGTTNPDPTSIFDVSSSTKGLLAPRMTTIQRSAIVSPANSLLVYDTDLKAFYYYDVTSTAWIKLNSASEKRNNHKIIKSAADLATELTAGGGTKYLLSTNTLYEINGTIVLAVPIELNDAYVAGSDTNQDVLFSAGTIFSGSTGGSIRNVTLSGGTAFNITGGASLVLQNTIIANMASVGTISGVGLYFANIVQFSGNANGITYNNIGTLLLSNQGWFGNNTGTFETLTGSFDLVQKISGFSTANGAAVALNVSSNPVITNGILLSVAFSGTSSTYINKYTAGTFPGFNFTNAWTVNCPGIPLESDNVASANIYYNGGITTGFVQTVSNGSELNLSGNSGANTTTAVNMFRSTSPQNNRITYTGKKTRTFQINAALSVRGNSGTGDYYAFFIKKNGTNTLVETNTLMRVNTTTDISSQAISGTVELAPNDYVEIWGQRLVGSGTTSITVFSLNLSIK
jgi:hypothetical protein